MLRFAIRAGLAAAAFWLAVALVPDVEWAAGADSARRLAILIVVGAVNGLLPGTLDRLLPGIRRLAWAAIAIAANVLFVVLLGLAFRALGGGLRVSGLSSRPLDVALAIGLTGAVTSLPILAELALRGRAAAAATGLRPHLDRRLAVLLIFILSGAAGLMYEVVWSRQLVLVFGNTTQAISAILTGFFGGLAIGSVVGGRIADRVRRPLRVYGILELALVVVVIITPLLFRALHELYRSGYGALETQPTLLALIRYGLALLALAPATMLMGATLPTLSRHLTRSTAELGGSFGRLYAVNTMGAVGGTILAGLVLIELVGLSGTLLLGALGSATAGVAAIVLDRRWPTASRSTEARGSTDIRPGPEAEPFVPPSTVPPDVRRLALAVAFISGLTSLGYQVLWTRLLASGSGNSTYVFTLILAMFLVGLSLGALFVARRMARVAQPMGWLGAAQLLVAGLALAGMPILAADIGVAAPLWLRVLIVVLPTTIVMGVTLPMASNLIGLGEHRVGRDAGLLLGANTIGAICGTFLIPFLAIPTIGSPRSVALLALVNAALGVVLLAREAGVGRVARRAYMGSGTAAAVLAAAALVVPNVVVADPGTNRMERAGTVYGAAEDEIASVQAGIVGNRKRLWVGGIGMTALTVDAKLMALMPEFVRPSAQRMLVIAFGMGSSYRSGLRSGLTVDGVELVPSVPAMFGYFQPDAANVLADPRGRVIIADGRNYAELTDQRYDIVVVDPPPPIESSGTAVLYSQEFYQASARRLTDRGVMMEWMPGPQSVDEFRAHVRTFSSVFPSVLLAFGPATKGVFMLGSTGPVALEPDAIASVLARPGVVEDLGEAADAPVKTREAWQALIPTLAWLQGSEVTRFAGHGPLITDDRPLTEYFVLRRTFGAWSPPMNEANLRAAAGRP